MSRRHVTHTGQRSNRTPVAPYNVMRFAQKVLFTAAFIHSESKFILQESDQGSIYSPFKQASISDGACYDKPMGKCEYNGNRITGCRCTSDLGCFVPDSSGKTLKGVVCSQDCSSDPCPSPPRGTAVCFGTNFCGIMCSSDSDCPDTEFCYQVGDDGVCLFKP
ncbi:hypothetical protein FOL47_009131 [Perkinsus chesapeaki]|uniref:Uncharacterized protein n=1 Tax=Perkinsus chesapeaki TaxID=330153 RepID=A0A7J6LAB3_PERCH|nr:hypothetical protein FOL47_009131 [Perkinsus chesapeaki]